MSHTADASGNLSPQRKYDAFGMVSDFAGTGMSYDYAYTGEEYDSHSGLLYLRARFYDASIGRFISADPYWGRLEEPVTQNRYAYVHNNPLLYTDPSGLRVECSVMGGRVGSGQSPLH